MLYFIIIQMFNLEIIIWLNNIQNLSKIIKLNIKSIFVSMNCVDVFNPKVVQATMGSLSRVQVIKVDLENILRKIT